MGRASRRWPPSLFEGQAVPYARAAQLLQELLGIQLSAGSIARFVTTCHEHLADVEAHLKAALVKKKVIHQNETGLRVDKTGCGFTSVRWIDSPITPPIRAEAARDLTPLALLRSLLGSAFMTD